MSQLRLSSKGTSLHATSLSGFLRSLLPSQNTTRQTRTRAILRKVPWRSTGYHGVHTLKKSLGGLGFMWLSFWGPQISWLRPDIAGTALAGKLQSVLNVHLKFWITCDNFSVRRHQSVHAMKVQICFCLHNSELLTLSTSSE